MWDVKGPNGEFYDELQASSDTQTVRFHRSDGDGLSGPIGRMEMENGPHVHVTRKVSHKPSGPTSRMEMENGPIGTRDT
jgi:hypothetical protein